MRLLISAALVALALTACNGGDGDCIEPADTSVEVPTWYVDADGDGYGDPDTEESECLPQGADVVYVGGDCDDTDPYINPGRSEVNDYWGADENCDGVTTGGGLVDADGDGWLSDEDCDDRNENANWGSIERCDDGVDNDCDGQVDTDPDRCEDNDGDGFSEHDGDCYDDNRYAFPGATEVCDGFDQDCDDSVDEDAGGVEHGLCAEEQ